MSKPSDSNATGAETTGATAASTAAGSDPAAADPAWSNGRLFALRGAITAGDNSEAAILEAAAELISEVMGRNAIDPTAMVSCIFTCTNDLDAQFPAVAARELGLENVPLLCAREIDVPGSLPMTIRLMLHYYAEPSTEPQHVYLRDAVSLRADLHAAQ